MIMLKGVCVTGGCLYYIECDLVITEFECQVWVCVLDSRRAGVQQFIQELN